MFSHKLDLKVEHIPPADLPVPRLPEVVKIEGTVFLDMRRFSGNPRVQLAPWKFIDLRQRIWINVVGQRNYPNHETLHLVTALEVTSEQVSNGLELTIDRSWLSRLDHRSALTLETFVTFDKSPNIDSAHELPRWTNLLLKSDTDLPAPTVTQTLNGVLDPELVSENAMIVITYDGMLPTDRVKPWWRGTPGEGSPELETVNGNSAGSIEVAVSVSAVAANEGETVDVSYTVERDGIERPSPITRVTVQKRRYVDVENFDEQDVKRVNAADNYTFTLPTMSIRLLEGAGTAGIMRFGSTTVGFVEALSFGMCINSGMTTPPQRFQFDFRVDYARISFTWAHLHHKGVVTYFDINGEVLGTNEYHGISEGGQLHQLIEFVAPGQSRIKSMRVEAEDYSFLDFFTMCG